MRIPKRILKIIKCAATENFRYALNSMRLSREKGGNRVTAEVSDGKRMVLVQFDDPEQKSIKGLEDMEKRIDGFSVLLSARSISTMASLSRAKGASDFVVIGESGNNGKVHIAIPSEETTTISVSPVDGEMPPCQEVIPKHKKGESLRVGINPRLLAEMLIAMADASEGGIGMWIEIGSKPTDPIKVETSTKESRRVVGVLMPVNMGKI